jgi:hypothetical protein
MEFLCQVGIQFGRDGVGSVLVAASPGVFARGHEIRDVEAMIRFLLLGFKVIEMERAFPILNGRFAVSTLKVLVLDQFLPQLAFARLEWETIKIRCEGVRRKFLQAWWRRWDRKRDHSTSSC